MCSMRIQAGRGKRHANAALQSSAAAQQALAAGGPALLLGLACSARGSLRSHPLYSLRCSGILIRVSAAAWAAAEAQAVGQTSPFCCDRS
jgi:hypothetical protein